MRGDAQSLARRLESARMALRGLTGAGLVLVFGHGVTVAVTDGLVYPPHAVWKAGLVIVTLGCISLAVLIARWFTPWESLWWDASLGLLGLFAALLALAAALLVHGIVGHRVFFGVVLGLLFPASVALLLVCVHTLRKTRRGDRPCVPRSADRTVTQRWQADALDDGGPRP